MKNRSSQVRNFTDIQSANRRVAYKLPRWKVHLSSYPELIELRFAKKSENHKALDLLDSAELQDMPYGLTDEGIIVPIESLRFFSTVGKFSEKKIHPPG